MSVGKFSNTITPLNAVPSGYTVAPYSKGLGAGEYVASKRAKLLVPVPHTLSTENLPEKPRKWFSDSEHKKPIVKIPSTTHNLDVLAGLIKKGMQDTNLTMDLVLCFLKAYYKTIMSEPLLEEWTSYGQVIGRKDDIITPLSLLTIVDSESNDFGTSPGTSVVEQEVDALAVYVLGIYRVLRTQHESHKQLICEKLTDLMKGYTQQGIHSGYQISSAPTAYNGWIANPSYLKMIAALDMFLFSNTEHSLAPMRIATVTSRFRDCAALTSIKHLSGVLGYSSCVLVGYWCFTPHLADQYLNLFTGDEELDKMDSYFPYQIDMGLVNKSSYSASVNQSIYFFVHAIGSLIGSRRSMNARYLLDSAVAPTIKLAIWVAIIHNIAVDYVITNINPNDNMTDTPLEAITIGRPVTLDAHAWFCYLQDNGFRFTNADIVMFEKMKKNMGDTIRNETIAKYLSKHSIVDGTVSSMSVDE